MAQGLAIIGNVSIDRVRLSGVIDNDRATLGGAALNIAAGYAYWGGKVRLCAHLGPNVRAIEQYTGFIDLTTSERAEHMSPEFLLEYDAEHVMIGVQYDESVLDASRLNAIHTRPPLGAHVHLCLRRPYTATDAKAILDAGFDLSIDVLLSSAAKQLAGLEPLLDHLSAIFCNADEWRLLNAVLPMHLAPLALVTAGRGPVQVWRYGKLHSSHDVTSAPMVDPTGAGDAFTGGYLRGYLTGLPEVANVALGMHVASQVISNFGALHILDGSHE
jgi:2-dehydro-3-deoxygluconokinase